MAAFLFLIKIEINSRKSYYLNSHMLIGEKTWSEILNCYKIMLQIGSKREVT